MSYIDFKNNETPVNDTNLNNMQLELLKLVFPIGSTYITQGDSNPAIILRFGTWERFNGKIAIGLDEEDKDFDSVGKIGGSKTKTLTVSNLPSHKHEQYAVSNPGYGGPGIRGTFNGVDASGQAIYSTGTSTGSAGKGQAFDVIPPYEIVGYMWIRRA
ncbi:MAG: hypothetical protein HFJ55_05125 [Clostridia bacterium]|jgi:microcystin-dependent protein|nr:hypothetical protein [Clostridia bacterium]